MTSLDRFQCPFVGRLVFDGDGEQRQFSGNVLVTNSCNRIDATIDGQTAFTLGGRPRATFFDRQQASQRRRWRCLLFTIAKQRRVDDKLIIGRRSSTTTSS